MILTLSGWDVNYEPIILTHEDGLRDTMTGQELAKLFISRLKSRTKSPDDPIFKTLARKCKLSPPIFAEDTGARKSSWTSFLASSIETSPARFMTEESEETTEITI